MNKSSIVIVALLALVAGVLSSLYLSNSKPIKLETGLWFGEQARALPAFALLDHNQQILDNNRLLGKWSLLFFGYTSCPDICPLTMQTLSEMTAAIEKPQLRDRLQVYFISVDPQRDQPEQLASYMAYFNPAFIGATAAPEQLNVLTGSLGISHQTHKSAEDDLSYGVDHSSAIVLINPAAEFAGLFSAPHEAIAMARDMTLIMERN
tara:strand:+ start:98 stop:718 length:621 start_codon:yes stop_codon:yes gene_type:complete